MLRIFLLTVVSFTLWTVTSSTSFALNQIHTSPEQMDSFVRPEPVYAPQYTGQKDRYNDAQFIGDPEVLVSRAKHESRDIRGQQEITVVATPIDDEPILISYDLGKMPYTIEE